MSQSFFILLEYCILNQFFFFSQPNRTYYLEDPESYALEWCKAINDVKAHYYGPKT